MLFVACRFFPFARVIFLFIGNNSFHISRSEHPETFFEGEIFNFPITNEKGASAHDRADEQQQQNIENIKSIAMGK